MIPGAEQARRQRGVIFRWSARQLPLEIHHRQRGQVRFLHRQVNGQSLHFPTGLICDRVNPRFAKINILQTSILVGDDGCLLFPKAALAERLLFRRAAQKDVFLLTGKQMSGDSHLVGPAPSANRKAEAVQPGDEGLVLGPIRPGSVSRGVD